MHCRTYIRSERDDNRLVFTFQVNFDQETREFHGYVIDRAWSDNIRAQINFEGEVLQVRAPIGSLVYVTGEAA
jgi:hypothetical protein